MKYRIWPGRISNVGKDGIGNIMDSSREDLNVSRNSTCLGPLPVITPSPSLRQRAVHYLPTWWLCSFPTCLRLCKSQAAYACVWDGLEKNVPYTLSLCFVLDERVSASVQLAYATLDFLLENKTFSENLDPLLLSKAMESRALAEAYEPQKHEKRPGSALSRLIHWQGKVGRLSANSSRGKKSSSKGVSEWFVRLFVYWWRVSSAQSIFVVIHLWTAVASRHFVMPTSPSPE